METLILALGNELMGDDGVGLKIGRILAERGCRVVEAGTDVFTLMSKYCGEERVVLIDAVISDRLRPGEVIHLSGDEIFRDLKAEFRSAHFMGLVDGLKLLRAVDERLAGVEFHFIGVVAGRIDLGMELSEEVKNAVPQAVETVLGLCGVKE